MPNIKLIKELAEAIATLAEDDTGPKVCRDTAHMKGPHIHVPPLTDKGETVSTFFDPIPRA